MVRKNTAKKNIGKIKIFVLYLMNCVIEKEIFRCSSPQQPCILHVTLCFQIYPRGVGKSVAAVTQPEGKDALPQSLSQYFISYLHYSICLHISLFLKKYHIASWLQCSVQFSHSVMSNSLSPHGLQHARPPCPSPTPGVYSDSCLLRLWCHPTISSLPSPSPPTFNLS